MSAQRWDRVWIVGGLAFALVLAAVAWFAFISPTLSEKADSQQQTEDAQFRNASLQSKVNQLKRESERAGDLQEQLKDVRSQVPPQHHLDAFTRQLTQQAATAGVQLISIVPGQPEEVAFPTPSTAAPDTSGEAGADGQSATTPPATPDANAGPVGKVYALTVSLAAQGTMADLRTFLALIEQQGPRRALVTNTGFTPAEDANALSPGNATAQPGNVGGSPAPAADGEQPTAGDTAASPQDAQQWSLALQLQVYVAPQSPEQESELHEDLGGNG